MPIYEYRCPACRATFELLRPIERAAEPAACPNGHANAQRVVSLVAARAWSGAPGPLDAPAMGGGCACASGGACGCAAP